MTSLFPLSVIGLGANLGYPLETFEKAVEHLASVGEIAEFSRVYCSEAQGPPQPDYHNAAVAMRFAEPPAAVLRALMDVERKCGRVRRERWGARVLDLDWLWIEGGTISTGALAVPHPLLTQRAFALRPLLDVAPAAEDPISGQPYTKWLQSVAAQRIAVLDAPGVPWQDATECRR